MAKINKEKQEAMPQKLLHELLGYNELTGGWVWIKKPSKYANNLVGQPVGHVNKKGYVVIRLNGGDHLAHRLAWSYVYGDYPDGEQPLIDHINGKKDDNRIGNLRVSSHSENQKNRKRNTNNRSGVTGVDCYEMTKPSGKIYVYWAATWNDENGKRCKKSFPVHKLGEDEAKQAAINYRAEQIRLLETNHGITYSPRHGT